MKILLVEDSATLRFTLRSFIEKAKHIPVIAKSGEEALQLVENDTIDLVIMDVEMPGLNGFETTRLLREWFGDHWVPIIFVTGKADEDSFREGIEAGGDDYLTKPVSPVILSAKIRAMERIVSMRNQLNKLNAELEALSQRDSLTQLYNRRTFDDLARQQLATLKRCNRPASVLMMDVDHFKQYNDLYGHPAGDVCLQRVAEALLDCVHRANDIVARYGGEEFIVLLPETNAAGALVVAEHIRQAVLDLNIPHDKSTTGAVVSISIGIATTEFTTGTNQNELVAQADKALYQAKQAGRNRVFLQEAVPHKTVLIADHDPDSLVLMSDVLRDHCNIVTAETGHECLDIAYSLRPDLIVLDLHMPEVNGLQICKKLQANQKTSDIPVVLIAAQIEEKSLAGGQGYSHLFKPFEAAELLSKVIQVLN